MALKQNIIYIYFKGKHQVTSKSQYQYNRKQYLYFADLNLPQVFEVHFSNRDKGESKTQIGNDKLVEIPDEYFWNGALQIYAWIYLHSGADDSETIYEIRIPLTKRAKPTDEEPLPVQQSAIDKAIAELNNAVNVTTENTNKTESDKIIVANIKDEVVDLKEDIDSTAATINQKAQDVIDASGRAETSALNAADSERKALNYSQQAEQSAQEALESKNIAKQKAEIATGASAEALGYRDEAVNARDIAVQAKQNIVDYRDETKGYRDETLNLKNNVQTLKNQIDETAEEIEDISDSVKEDAQSASQSASSANQSSINASESASQAGQFADGAEQSANQAEQSMNMTEDYKNQSETYKNQSETFKNQAEQFKNQSETNVSHYPKIVNDYWYVWDATNGEYINTNVDANGIKGDTGNGIASVALNDDYTLTITFTDDTTYTTSSIRGQQGEKGDTGKTGESGVYIGTEEPENEDIKVWIDIDESADSGTVEDLIADITDLKEELSDISSMLYTYQADTSLWSQGRLSSVNGSGYNDTTTAIKSLKIPDNIEMVTALTGYKIAIFAYTKAENTYVGVWNGSELAKVNYYFEQTTVDISNLNSTYNIKLMARAISGENVAVDNAVNVLFGVKTLTNITDSVDAVKSKSDGLFDKGFIPLENVIWARGGWYANNDFRPSMYKYCAAVYPAFTIEKDTVLVAKRGFKFRLSYTKSDGTRETFGDACMGIIPSGATAVNLTVERIAEDHTEELTVEQVAEFGNAIMSVGYHSTDYTNYRDTFTGLEMYESMAIIGDSYSAGNNTNNWGKCLGRMIGTSVTVWAQSGYDSSDWITTYLSRLLEADAKDLYWINLGINDGAGVVSDPSHLGSSADVDETVYTDFDTFPNTFWGNMGRIIRNIQTHAPNAKIVLEKTMFATMLNAQRDLPTTATATINSAIVEIGAFYGIPVIDQLDDAFYCSKEYAKSMTSNHPRKYTWVGMANANRRLFARAVLANPTYFY